MTSPSSILQCFQITFSGMTLTQPRDFWFGSWSAQPPWTWWSSHEFYILKPMYVCVRARVCELVNEELCVCVSIRAGSSIGGKECFSSCVSVYMCLWCGGVCTAVSTNSYTISEPRSVNTSVLTVILLEPRPSGLFTLKPHDLTSTEIPLEGKDLVCDWLTDFMVSPAPFSLLPNSANGTTTASFQLRGSKFASFSFHKPTLSFPFYSFSLSCLHVRLQYAILLDSFKNLLSDLSCTWFLLFSKASLYRDIYLGIWSPNLPPQSQRWGNQGKLPLNWVVQVPQLLARWWKVMTILDKANGCWRTHHSRSPQEHQRGLVVLRTAPKAFHYCFSW